MSLNGGVGSVYLAKRFCLSGFVSVSVSLRSLFHYWSRDSCQSTSGSTKEDKLIQFMHLSAEYIGTKTAVQIRSHAQKFFSKVFILK